MATSTGATLAYLMAPESFELDSVRPFVWILAEKVRARRGRPPKDEVRLVPLTDVSYVRLMESWMITTRPRRREPLWAVTDETMRNWLKQAVKGTEADRVHFSIPVPPPIPSATVTSCICSIIGNPESHSGTGIPAQWRCIRGCLRWIWRPRRRCRSPQTGGMRQRFCVPCRQYHDFRLACERNVAGPYFRLRACY